ncbi:hypothetical protein TR2A62_3358 [Thalassobium sp. R2A62]|nr:hypothetical protein TR2A62_3358 [Thalassobium sp. R2A62]
MAAIGVHVIGPFGKFGSARYTAPHQQSQAPQRLWTGGFLRIVPNLVTINRYCFLKSCSFGAKTSV